LSWQNVSNAVGNGGLMLLRVVVFIAIATVVWLPIGAAIGLRPSLAEKVQPLAQLLADFPANLPFLIAAQLIVQFDLSPVIWLSPLMILSDFREAIASFRIPG
jgi:NitT/TauT family transport system permease protein